MTYRKSTLLPFIGIVLAIAMSACNASTAHISSLQMGKDKAVTTAVTTFAPGDTIYAQGNAANLPGKVTMQWQLIAEKVAGEPANEKLPALNMSTDLASDGVATYTLTPPPKGWPLGTYQVILTMMDAGVQRDQKTQEFTVAAQ